MYIVVRRDCFVVTFAVLAAALVAERRVSKRIVDDGRSGSSMRPVGSVPYRTACSTF